MVWNCTVRTPARPDLTDWICYWMEIAVCMEGGQFGRVIHPVVDHCGSAARATPIFLACVCNVGYDESKHSRWPVGVTDRQTVSWPLERL